MAVRAKFELETKTLQLTGTREKPAALVNLIFVPVTSGCEANERFFRWTPAGKIELSGLLELVGAQFEIGREYYIDFTAAPLPDAVAEAGSN